MILEKGKRPKLSPAAEILEKIMKRTLPPKDEVKHMFYGAAINEYFTIHSIGDTLKNKNIEWVLSHYPQGFTGDDLHGFKGDSHDAFTYSTFREAVKDGLADNVLNIVIREREKWTHKPFRKVVCGAKLTANIGREYSEFVEKELSKADIDSLINELTDVIEVAEEKKRDLIEQRQARHFGESGYVSNKTRGMVRERIGRRG